ncbi:AraC family transcriptional regulator [Prauserella sp. PE36]|uniref:GlxA family transcriptional regulator n=1 Tax=Prauserella endophytica TaxID=1592324 RepID=A0ABY2RV17_9PSEU|nr:MULTISPECIES: GlxA family transcriptional regulator [Prauserella]RBM18847.1 AraC family transcriptional regulator [Prauserella sp. PE36]TKG61817.1 GlxA family transcriptional regulator [Prauserella endophytica]
MNELASPPSRRVVAIAVFDGVEVLDVAGPMQVFSTASRTRGSAQYEVVIAAAERGAVRTSGGMTLLAERTWDDLGADVDTLVVPGGLQDDGDRYPLIDHGLVTWLRTFAGVPRRVVSVCTGAHMLAAAGLLDGRSATTHWSTADLLAAEHPEAEVASDAVFVRDGHVWTSAGVSAGIDLALALVAADHGEEVARQVAQWLVVYLRRAGGQHQFSALLGPRRSVSDRLEALLSWIPEHLREDLSVETLAARVNVSPRHLSRLIREEMNTTPGALVEGMRLQSAVDQLLHSDAPLSKVATASGFGSVTGLHRAFARKYKVSPGEYRRRFSTRPDLDRHPSL